MFCFVGAINIIQVYEKSFDSLQKFNENNQIASTFSKIGTKLRLKKARWPTLLRLKVVFYKKNKKSHNLISINF